MPRKWPVQLVSWNYKTRCHRACSLSQCGRAGSCSVCKSQYPFRGAMSRPCLVPCLPAGSLHLSWASTGGEGLVDVDVDTPHGTASTTACICFLCGDMPRCSPDDSGGGAPGGQLGEETNLNKRRIKLPVPPIMLGRVPMSRKHAAQGTFPNADIGGHQFTCVVFPTDVTRNQQKTKRNGSDRPRLMNIPPLQTVR